MHIGTHRKKQIAHSLFCNRRVGAKNTSIVDQIVNSLGISRLDKCSCSLQAAAESAVMLERAKEMCSPNEVW